MLGPRLNTYMPLPFPTGSNMGGILKNESQKSEQEQNAFDRSQVLKNTELNAQLGIEGEKLRQSLRTQNQSQEDGVHKKYPKTKAPQALRAGELDEDEGFVASKGDVEFNENEISNWDQQRGQTEKITEPNTPYMGTAADTEYYDEDPVPDDIDMGGSVS